MDQVRRRPRRAGQARAAAPRPGRPAKVEIGYVERTPKAYPFYDWEYKANVETLRRWLEEHTPNVYPVGRNGMHRYNNQDHSMYTAMLSVENIFGADHDVWSVNVEEEYHEEVADSVDELPSVSPTGGASQDDRGGGVRGRTHAALPVLRRVPVLRHDDGAAAARGVRHAAVGARSTCRTGCRRCSTGWTSASRSSS